MQSTAPSQTRWQSFGRRLFTLLATPLACAALTAALPAQAAFPDKPLRVVVPFAPGGGTDAIARTLGQGMAVALGQPVLIDNKPGAGTLIGSEFVAKSPPDGYTLVMSTFAHAVNPSMQAKMPFDTDKAFAPVAFVGVSPNVLVVRADAPWKTLADLAAAAKASPGKLTFASMGNGTSAHLSGELFKSLDKLDLTHVPYRGSGPALTDLLGGQVNMMFATASSAQPFITSGKLRALAVTTARRSPAFPDVPTMAEAGVKNLEVTSWQAVVAPKGLPAAVREKAHRAIVEVLNDPAVKDPFVAVGFEMVANTPAQFAEFQQAEFTRWKKVIEVGKISVE